MKTSMLLFFVLACMCPLVSTNMCISCQRGKYNTFLSNQPCTLCEANMYAPNTGMTTCLACPTNSKSVRGSASCACESGMTWSIESTACVTVCESGLVRSATGLCLPPWNTSLVMNLEMKLMVPQNTTETDVQTAIQGAISDAYGVPKENIFVTVVALSMLRRRMLLQNTDAVRFAVEVRVVFPSDTSAANITTTKARLGAMNNMDLNAALKVAPVDINFVVLESGPVQIKNLGEIPSVPSTPSVSITPSPPGTSSKLEEVFSNIGIIVGVVVGAVVLFIGLLVIICCLCKDIPVTKG